MLKKLFAITVFLCGLVAARAEYFTIENYEVNIRLHREGYFEVTERIVVQFDTQRHGIYRTIPVKYSRNGEGLRIRISDIEVEGRKQKVSREGRDLRIRIGDPDKYVDGQQTYVIRYRVRGAWLFEEEHTEFYWNVIGHHWEVPIERIRYRIELPGDPGLTEEDYYLYTGRMGAREAEASLQYENGLLRGTSTRPFEPGEGLTIAIRLPADYVERPAAVAVFLRKYGLLGIPFLLLSFLGGLWYRHGREDRFVEMVHYYPPDNFPPAEAGAFIDDRTDNRDLIALIPYWAGQGYLEMREIEEKKLLIFSDTDYELIKLKDLEKGRPDYEYTIFRGLFADGDVVRVSDLKNSFYKTMNSAQRRLTRSVRDRQLYTPRSRTIYKAMPFAAFLCFGLAVFLVTRHQFIAAAATALSALLLLLLRRPMLKKNKEGMEWYQQLYGFRMFVEQADRDRLERLLAEDPGYFEKTLPYAIAFGMAKKWAEKFDGLFTEPPRWYHAYHSHGRQDNSFQSFAGSFDSSIREMQSVFTSSPSSSGSSGGGSSGGGFGGGGGGSW